MGRFPGSAPGLRGRQYTCRAVQGTQDQELRSRSREDCALCARVVRPYVLYVSERLLVLVGVRSAETVMEDCGECAAWQQLRVRELVESHTQMVRARHVSDVDGTCV